MPGPGTDVSSIDIELVHQVGNMFLDKMHELQELESGHASEQFRDLVYSRYSKHTADGKPSPIYTPTCEEITSVTSKVATQIHLMANHMFQVGTALTKISQDSLEKEMHAAAQMAQTDTNLNAPSPGGTSPVPGGTPPTPGLTPPGGTPPGNTAPGLGETPPATPETPSGPPPLPPTQGTPPTEHSQIT